MRAQEVSAIKFDPDPTTNRKKERKKTETRWVQDLWRYVKMKRTAPFFRSLDSLHCSFKTSDLLNVCANL
jgi:histone deacetylase complex regulatory component SIN3